MKKELADSLLVFYQKMLEPEFSVIKHKLLEHDDNFKSILGHFDSLYKRLDRLEDEYYSIVHGIKRIEEVLEGKVKQQDTLEKKIQEMKERFKNLQDRLSAIEEKVQHLS